MAKPPLFSSRKNSRCKPCRSAPEAPSTPPPLPTAKSTKSNTSSGKAQPAKADSSPNRRSLLEFFRLLRTRHEIYLGSRTRQVRQPLRRHRRPRRDFPRHAQRRALGLFQERRNSHSRPGLRCPGRPDRRLRWQRTHLSHFSRRRRLRALQRAQERNHRAGARSLRQHLCGRRR
jgi:hypothetical protein